MIDKKRRPKNGIPVVSRVENPFKGDAVDLYYKDPVKNLHGVITVKTLTREKADTYERNEYRRDSGEELVDARGTGVYEDELSDDDPYYKGYTIVAPGSPLDKDLIEIALEQLSNEYGADFYFKEVDWSDIDDISEPLLEIKRDCYVCGATKWETELQQVSTGTRRIGHGAASMEIPWSYEYACKDECSLALTL